MLLDRSLFASQVFFIQALGVVGTQPCPLLGPDVPTPKHLSNSTSFNAALSRLETGIETALKTTGEFGKLPAAVSFAIDIFSTHEEKTLFTYFHNAPELANASSGVSKIDEDTIFRIGSISKLLTVYTALLANDTSIWQQPISTYIPEFSQYMAAHEGSTDHVNIYNFDDITFWDLATELSGLPRDSSPGPMGDEALRASFPGLPAVSPLPSNITSDACPDSAGVPCTTAAYLENILSRRPLLPAASQPAYSNLNLGILALAFENITGSSFEELFQRLLVDPLNLTSTLYSSPSNRSLSNINALIPINVSVSGFLANIYDGTPAGGYYSSISDMRKVGKSILSSSLLSNATTQRWLKPYTLTSSSVQSVGAPWEIYSYVSKTNRKIDVYTKSGSIGVYLTEIALIPIFNVGFTVLTGGEGNAQVSLSNMVASGVLDALELAAHEEASAKYAGSYGTGNSMIVIEAPLTAYNHSGPGLQLTKYTFQGYDVFNVFSALSTSPANETEIRLYPMGLISETAKGTIEGWRAVAYSTSKQVTDERSNNIVTDLARCNEWFVLDGLAYGGVAFDDFNFVVGKDGRVTDILPRVWKTEYPKML